MVNSRIVQEDIDGIVNHRSIDWESLKGKTVLISGATGMIGFYLAQALFHQREALDLKIVLLARDNAKIARMFGDTDDSRLTVVVQDVTHRVSLPEAISVDLIVHAASPASPDVFERRPADVIDANVLGTRNLLELAKAHGAALCLISTMEIYGSPRDAGTDTHYAEGDMGVLDPTDVRSCYPESKRAAENMAACYGDQYGVAYSIARLSHTYGPGMDRDDSRVQMEFLRKSLNGENIIMLSDGSLERTYTYVADAASAILCVVSTPSEHKVFNVANNDARISIRRLAELAASGEDIDVLTQERSPKSSWGKASGVFLDTTRIESLGWSASVSPTAGIARTKRHLRET